MRETVEQFWRGFLSANPDVKRSEPYQVWFFSNNRESSLNLAELVIQGKKTATASMQMVNEVQPEKAPVDGGYSVVTSFEGEPLCVIQTTEIRHLPFNEVELQFAFDEGEGDQTLADWREAHHAYFTREAEEFGFKFDERTIICCERFRLLYPKVGQALDSAAQ